MHSIIGIVFTAVFLDRLLDNLDESESNFLACVSFIFEDIPHNLSVYICNCEHS